jgi:hypothetical protein
MDPFCERAIGLLVWRAFLTALVTVLLTIACRLQLPDAFLAGADVALLFSLGLILWSQRLTDERIAWTQTLLFAKRAAAVAAALSASAFIFAAE